MKRKKKKSGVSVGGIENSGNVTTIRQAWRQQPARKRRHDV